MKEKKRNAKEGERETKRKEQRVLRYRNRQIIITLLQYLSL